MTDLDLDRLLAEARANPPGPEPEFMARMLADALAALPRPAAPAPIAVPQPVARPVPPLLRLWSALSAGFGGGGVLAGLGAVAVMGVWVGYTDPAGITDRFSTTSDAGLEIAPAAEYFLTGG